MGRSTVARNWAITVTGDKACIPKTTSAGIKFEYADKSWVVVVGPLEGGTKEEQANQHLGVRCLTRSVTKGNAREALAAAVHQPVDHFDRCYFKVVETSWNQYVGYCFKQKMGNVGSLIKEAHQKLQERGRPVTKRTLNEELAKGNDFEFFCKRLKPGVNEYVGLDCMQDMRGVREKPLDPVVNRLSFINSFQIWQNQVYLSMQKGNDVTTWEYQLWQDLSLHVKTAVVEVLSLLPFCTRRDYTSPDNLPGLYLWGDPYTGKSTFFNCGQYLKMFPLDAQGVSRFKLECNQAGFLFDDVPEGFLDRPDISGTVRQTALGGVPNIKVHSTTETVVGYVIFTSNHRPQFLLDCKPESYTGSDESWDVNQKAWKRRFITLRFVDPVDADPLYINWNDPKIRTYAAHLCQCSLMLLRNKAEALYIRYFTDLDTILKEDYGEMGSATEAGYHVPGADIIRKQLDPEALARVEQRARESMERDRRLLMAQAKKQHLVTDMRHNRMHLRVSKTPESSQSSAPESEEEEAD